MLSKLLYSMIRITIYDFLVASDAVGMGLNLSIKRVIFQATGKFNGQRMAHISIPEIKQIAGRAGRYKTARDAIKEDPMNLTDGTPKDAQAPIQVCAVIQSWLDHYT